MSKKETVEKTDEELEAELNEVVSDAVDEVTFTEEIENDEGTDDGAGATEDDSDADVSDDGKSGSDTDEVEDESETKEGDEEETADDPEGEGTDDGDDAKKGGDKGGDDKDGGDDETSKPDHLNDPIPEGTNARTSQRIQSLISDVKELSAVREERDEILNAIERTGATPEQYAGALTVIKLFNSETPDDKRKALEIVRGMERDLAFDIGETDGLVKLEDFPDLQQEVEAGTITEKYALELAGKRAREKYLSTKQETASQAKTEQQRTQEIIARGKQDLNTLGKELMNDPAYRALYPQFTELLQTTLRRVHPTEWKDAAQEVFVKLKKANPTAGQAAPPAKQTNKPLRPKSGSSGNNKASESDSALDAMNDALSGV